MNEQKRVFLGMPAGDGVIHAGTAQAFFLLTTRHCEVMRMVAVGSVLGNVFNRLWGTALGSRDSAGLTHFAMLHSDVAPDAYWLDALLAELERSGADVLSAVMPIKDSKGLTSTAVGDPNNIWDYRRITMRELLELPDTFSIDGVPARLKRPGDILLINTGCWVCDLRRPWWTQLDERGELKFRFTLQDRVVPNGDGRYRVEFAPEDWFFSRLCHEAGAKVMATRVVHAEHFGRKGWRNDIAYGSLETDLEACGAFDRKANEEQGHDERA